MHRMLLYLVWYDVEGQHQFSSLALAALQNLLNKLWGTALGLVEEKKIGTSTEEDTCADNNALKIDE